LLSKGKTKQAHAHENIDVEDTLRKASLSPSVFSGMRFAAALPASPFRDKTPVLRLFLEDFRIDRPFLPFFHLHPHALTVAWFW
jgi:hypothetical protein